MTMYEDLLENSGNKDITNLILNIMKLDKEFPAPNGSRRSGKTIYKNIIMLTKFLSDDSIRGLVFDSIRRETKIGERLPDDYIISYYHDMNWAERNCRQMSEVVKDMFDEADRDYFRFERDRIIKI